MTTSPAMASKIELWALDQGESHVATDLAFMAKTLKEIPMNSLQRD